MFVSGYVPREAWKEAPMCGFTCVWEFGVLTRMYGCGSSETQEWCVQLHIDGGGYLQEGCA